MKELQRKRKSSSYRLLMILGHLRRNKKRLIKRCVMGHIREQQRRKKQRRKAISNGQLGACWSCLKRAGCEPKSQRKCKALCVR